MAELKRNISNSFETATMLITIDVFSESKMRVRVKMIIFVQTHGWSVLLRRQL